MNIGDMDIEKLLLIVLLIAILYYPLCGVVGFIEFIQGRKRGHRMSEEYISRSAAIKALQSVPDGNWKAKRYVDEIKALPSVPSVEPMQWIPVSERLPNRMGAYLVTLTYNDGIDVTNMLWWHNKQIGWAYDMNDRVKAWMPLPKPYESEETQ